MFHAKPLAALVLAVLGFGALPAAASAHFGGAEIVSGPSGLVSTPDVTFTFQAGRSDHSDWASFRCRLDSTDWADWTRCASPVTYTGLEDGPHRFEVRTGHGWWWWHGWHGHFDHEPAVASFEVDATPPQTTIDSAPSGTIATGEATVAFSSDEPGHFECRLDSADDFAWEACESPTTFTGLADDPHTVDVRAVDLAGNVDPTPAQVGFAVDTVAPVTAIEGGPSGPIQVSGATFTFSAGGASEFECRLDSSDEAAWKPCASPISYSGLADGPHLFEVRGVDAVGNVDPSPASAAFVVDTTPPDTAIDGGPADRLEVTSAGFSFGSENATVFECRLDSSDEAAWRPCASPISYSGFSQGPHTFEVRARDALGNVDPTPARVTFFVDIPVNGQRLAVAPLAGEVLIKLPGAKKFTPLTQSQTIPVGSVVDTTDGKVNLASVNATGEEQRAAFFKGLFRVDQQLGSGLVSLELTGGDLGQCGSERGRASASGKRSGRGLWGSGKGQFRTEGTYGSATVRGTIWLTEDRCNGTFVKVRRGVVAVRDFPLGKTVSVPAGSSYLAHRPGT